MPRYEVVEGEPPTPAEQRAGRAALGVFIATATLDLAMSQLSRAAESAAEAFQRLNAIRLPGRLTLGDLAVLTADG